MVDIKSYGSFFRVFGLIGSRTENYLRRKDEVNKVLFTKDLVTLTIGEYEFSIAINELTVNSIAVTNADDAALKLSNELSVSTSAIGNNINGNFTSSDGKTIIVTNGLVTQISSSSEP